MHACAVSYHIGKAKDIKSAHIHLGNVVINPVLFLVISLGPWGGFKYPPILWYSSSPKVETDSSFLEREPDLMTHLEGIRCGIGDKRVTSRLGRAVCSGGPSASAWAPLLLSWLQITPDRRSLQLPSCCTMEAVCWKNEVTPPTTTSELQSSGQAHAWSQWAMIRRQPKSHKVTRQLFSEDGQSTKETMSPAPSGPGVSLMSVYFLGSTCHVMGFT